MDTATYNSFECLVGVKGHLTHHIKNHVAEYAVHLEPSPENPDDNEQDVLEDFHAQVKCLRGSTQCTKFTQ